ncbi:MAG: hypothetical protein R3F21_19595 [Myxococcota bacterium]
MDGIWIWLAAVSLYGVFLLWYENWRGALRPEEIASFAEAIEARGLGDASGRESLLRFMEQDDGREFMMLNLVRMNPDPLPHPETGEPTPAGRLLRRYLGTFLPRLARRAGHPLLQARKVGGYVDSWNAAPDPGWSFIGYMRYRSRRDLMEMILTPGFEGAHAFKLAAMPTTFSFPTQPTISLYAGPRIWLALGLALCAALLHLAAQRFSQT